MMHIDVLLEPDQTPAQLAELAGLCEQGATEPDEVLIDGNVTPAGRAPNWRWRAAPGRTWVCA